MATTVKETDGWVSLPRFIYLGMFALVVFAVVARTLGSSFDSFEALAAMFAAASGGYVAKQVTNTRNKKIDVEADLKREELNHDDSTEESVP